MRSISIGSFTKSILIEVARINGLLLEADIAAGGGVGWLVVGVGINVNQFPDRTEIPATSLVAEGLTSTAESEAVLESFLSHFGRWHQTWLESGFDLIRRLWLDRAAGVGEAVTARLNRETVLGRFVGLDGDGALLLAPAEGGTVRRIAAGDVFFPELADDSAVSLVLCS